MQTKKNRRFFGPQKSQISAVIKVPGLNNLGKNNGCRNAGNALISELINIRNNEKGKKIEVEKLDLEETHVNNNNLDEQEELICENALDVFKKQDKIIFLGGDHSITYSTGKAFLDFCENEKKMPCLIVFDAHVDLMPPVKNPTHEEWLRALIEEGFPIENILIVGARNIYSQERDFLKENKIKQISVNQLNENLEEMTDIIMEFASGKELYVSLDIDVIDASFASSTGYPETGGLSSRQIIYIMQRMNMMKNLKAIDIVEINSRDDKTGLTVKLGAKILAELL